MDRPVTLLPELSDELVLQADGLPTHMSIGESRLVSVVIENKSAFSVFGSQSGILLGNYWLDENGKAIESVNGRAHFIFLPSGARQNISLPITAPGIAGNFILVIDLVEEGSHWLNFFRGSAPRSKIAVV